MDGLIVVDKPRGPTSHDVVARLRRILGGVKTGHCGTLDPEASGMLLVAVGRAARLFPFLSGHDKAYAGTIRFGFATDTYDAAGRPTAPESTDLPAEDALREAMRRLEGRIRQIPPAYSALKQDGQPFYKLARAEPRGPDRAAGGHGAPVLTGVLGPAPRGIRGGMLGGNLRPLAGP